MVTCSDVMEFLEQIAPQALAEEWDNVGLMAGSKNAGIKKILVCLDVTFGALKKAVAEKADLIVSHHPLIFKGIKRIVEDDVKGRQIYAAIRNGISVISAHTNLDYADRGVNYRLASVLGLTDTVLLGDGPGRVGMLENRKSLNDFVRHVKECLDVPAVRVVGRADAGIQKVAVFSGSFDDDLSTVQRSGAEVIVTGDVKYHTALDAAEAGMCMIDAGHFNTEKIVLPYLAASLAERFPEVEITRYKQETDPFITY